MPGKKNDPHRDQSSFDIRWSQHDFFTTPLRTICKEIYLKGGDLDLIDTLRKSLFFADPLDTWRREAGGRRRSENAPTKGKLRQSIQTISFFALDCINFSVQEERKEHFSSGMKETLLGLLLISYAANPEDFRSGGNSDRCGSFFLMMVTEHLREKRVRPRYLLAARLLREIRGQRYIPAKPEATKAKVRVDQFKRHTPDWQFRLREFTEKLRYLSTT